MSPLNYLWLWSIEHFVIVLPFNYVGWEGSYCFLFLEADSSLRLVAWGRDVLKWDSEGFEFWWTRIIFEFTIGVVLKVHIPAPVRSWGVLEFILGIWNSNYIAWKITQAYECEWHTFFLYRRSERLWVLHKYKETPRTECVSTPFPVYPVRRGRLRW